MIIPNKPGEIKDYSMYRVEKLKDHIFHIEDRIDNPSSMYCIIGSEKVLWIDTANTHIEYEDELTQIAETLADGKEIIVAITHNHYDHVGGLNAFKNKTILFPLKDKDDKLETSDYQFIEDGDMIDLGNKQLKAVEVPGHTVGSMVYIDAKEELVITGDAIGSSYVWLFFMDQVLEHYKKGIHHLYNEIKNYQDPLFMCGHRWQQYQSIGRDPLSPINAPMTMQYLLDMIKLVDMIEAKTALTRPFDTLGKPEEHCVYSFAGSKAEIDSFVSLMK